MLYLPLMHRLMQPIYVRLTKTVTHINHSNPINSPLSLSMQYATLVCIGYILLCPTPLPIARCNFACVEQVYQRIASRSIDNRLITSAKNFNGYGSWPNVLLPKIPSRITCNNYNSIHNGKWESGGMGPLFTGIDSSARHLATSLISRPLVLHSATGLTKLWRHWHQCCFIWATER